MNEFYQNITDETMGFNVILEHKRGTRIVIWVPNIMEALIHIQEMWGEGNNYIRIFPMKYKNRMEGVK